MEIVTLQFGNLSNHIMTHYWNIQDEQLKYPDSTNLRSEALYYETNKGQFPFTLYFDQRDNFGNYFGCFDSQKLSKEEAEKELLDHWQGGYNVTENDYIEK